MRAWMVRRGLVLLAVTTGAAACLLFAGSTALADSNSGDVWVDNVGQPAGPGHEMDPHLACQDINLWGSGLADSGGSFTVDGWPPSGSQEQDYPTTSWAYNASAASPQVLAVISVRTLIEMAIANGDTPQSNQGYHFKLDFSQDPQKHKTFWVKCTATQLPRVFFGYADTYDSRGTGVPSVWQNNPAPGFSNVIFEGCGLDATSTSCVPTGGQYDAAAIRIDNPAGFPAMTVSNPVVTVGPTGGAPACSYDPWGPGFSVVLAAGQELVLTQTGGADPCHNNLTGNYNFDVSESWQKSPGYPSCTSDGWKPVLTITVDGVTKTITDTGEVMNTGGVDFGGPQCGGHNEFQDWAAQTWPF